MTAEIPALERRTRLEPALGDASPVPAPGRLARIIAALLRKRMHAGCLTVCWPGGGVSRIATGAPGPDAEIHLRRWRALRRLATGGTVGLAESYMDGDWDSPDLAAAVELGALHRRVKPRAAPTAALTGALRRLRHRLNANSRPGSRRNIAYHYDLGNDFYREWLDPGMTYSSAIFAPGDNSLEAAQTRKYRRLLALLDTRPGETLLEIGCGWGGFAVFAAREYGLRVTAITLSREQFDAATQRVHAEGLDDRVEVRLQDYRDVDERFDHVASIEMFEAVGETYWPAFFAMLRDCLKDGGRAALQIITIDDALFDRYRRGVDFIQRYIFPGGMLPSPAVLREQVRRAGLDWAGDDGFGSHYARTLAEWRRRFEAAWPRISPLGFDQRFRCMWTLYLAYCEGGFRAGNIDVRQVLLRRG